MRLTEKELNEFPIGTKIYRESRKYFKLDNSNLPWREMEDYCWLSNESILAAKIQKVEIPTYTEYIPPKHILDDKEKEHLSAVVSPARDKIKKVRKVAFAGMEDLVFFAKTLMIIFACLLLVGIKAWN